MKNIRFKPTAGIVALSGAVITALSLTPLAPSAFAAGAVSAFGSMDAAYLTAPSGSVASLYNARNALVATSTADVQNAVVIHEVVPGSGYYFKVTADGTTVQTSSFTVQSQLQPKTQTFYNSTSLHVGLNYITMRDGVTLAATVRLPYGKTTLAAGPFPTLIEYSGYGTAGPGSLLDQELGNYKGNPSLLPDTATIVGAVVAPLSGFATVSLQMRGTGCSGGAYDLFGPSEATDGYDAVQEISAQPWVLHHKVGLVGISYSGISEFAVAGLNPPGLASIAPLSPTEDLWSTGSPGGIYNSGFAASWIGARINDSLPSSATTGQPWAWAEIQTGDQVCLANQHFHNQSQPITTIWNSSAPRLTSQYDLRSPVLWAPKIKVPVFLAGALQDEQVGPQWTSLIPALANDKKVFVTVQNGTHGDALDADVLNRWLAFNDLYVAQQIPTSPSILAALVFKGLDATIGGTAVIPNVPQIGAKTYAQALKGFESTQPRVLVNFDNGSSSQGFGVGAASYSAGFTAYPPTNVTSSPLYLGPNGTLLSTAPALSTVSYQPNPRSRPDTSSGRGFSAWAAAPNYNWTPLTSSGSVGFITPALSKNLTVVGPASLNISLRSTSADTDLQATISEVLPNGQEIYVTNGFFRAGYGGTLQKAKSTVFAPSYSFLSESALPTSGAFTSIRIPIDPIAFTFRQGARLRVTIEAPGGDRPLWAFANTYVAGATNTIQLHASTLVLPVVANIQVASTAPVCSANGSTSSNRGQPCRTYLASGNGG